MIWGADHVGRAIPHRFKHLMTDAKWNTDLLRDQVGSRVVEGLGDPGAVGVDNEYCGASGDVRNVQTMVMLTYASIHGHAYIDRALYLPESWTRDSERLKPAKVPVARKFATKSQLAAEMVVRSIEAGVRVAAYVGDPGYGKDAGLRTAISSRSLAYVFAVRKNQSFIDDAARRSLRIQIYRTLQPDLPLQYEAKTIAIIGPEGFRPDSSLLAWFLALRRSSKRGFV